MIRNYIAVVLRNLANHKLFTTINILGLSLGVAATVLIMLFVAHDMSRHC